VEAARGSVALWFQRAKLQNTRDRDACASAVSCSRTPLGGLVVPLRSLWLTTRRKG
jgi:hypothetical protein